MSNLNVPPRTIFCKDNIDVLRGINSGTIDLIYLDPPFNKKKKFTAPIGSSAEGAEFSDIFRKDDIKDEWVSSIYFENTALHAFLTHTKTDGVNYNYCYLVFMAIRLLECKRILKSTGSIFLHCDSTMSHYLKVVMDCIFGEKNFRNEIVWCYHGPGSPKMRQFNRKSDTIFWYSFGKTWTFNGDDVRIPHKDGGPHVGGYGIDKEISAQYGAMGKIPENWWVIRIAARSKTEYKGYPTQKPLALMERIIKASSNKGDVVLDPFCGCATTCIAAEKLERQWIGIDISHKAYDLVRERLGEEIPPDLFNPEEPRYTTKPPVRAEAITDAERGYVYVIGNPAFPGAYKVGIAKDVKRRLGSYQTSDPNRGYKVEYSVFCTNYVDLEIKTHQFFGGNRENEWVTADKKKIIGYIKAGAENVTE